MVDFLVRLVLHLLDSRVLELRSAQGRSSVQAASVPFGAWLAGMAALQSHCPLLAHEHQWAGHFGLIAPVLVVWALLRRSRVGD